MSKETLLGNDGDSISRSARDGVEDVVPDGSLVLLVGTATSSVDGEDADIISSRRGPQHPAWRLWNLILTNPNK